MASISETLAIAFRHHRAGQWEYAEQICRGILDIDPKQPDALHFLGVVALQTGRHERAVEFLQEAIRANGAAAILHHQLGAAFRALGRSSEAIASFRRTLQLAPDFAESHRNLAETLREQGNISEAAICFQNVLRLHPESANAHNSLGVTLMRLGRYAEALACFQQALRLDHNHANANNNLGAAFYEQGRLAEAVACYRRALRLNSDHPDAFNNLGNALEELGEFAEAICCFEQALRLQPEDSGTLMQFVHLLQQVCLWDELDGLAERVIRSVEQECKNSSGTAVSPVSFLSLPLPTTAEQQMHCARQWVEHQLPSSALVSQDRPQHASRRPKPKITVGYLSADFREHPVSHHIVELLEAHDRSQFDVIGYSYGPDDGSRIRQRVIKAVDRFVDLTNTAFDESADRIRQDGVDVLVDLTGYTQHSRPQILALRPAPIQVSYLGYLATMGASFIDYVVVDEFAVPQNQQPFFTERLLHLPGCFQVNGWGRAVAAHAPSRSACGLPEEGFVFCCFNNTYKITPALFEVWMRLLKSIPGSVLWLSESHGFAAENLRREAKARNVAAERLVFAPHCPLPEYRAKLRLADLFLDTFPYNAGATASDALWIGCPLLTVAGETFVSRMAGSLLHTLDLPELITTSLEEYEGAARRLATDREFLESLRRRLSANRSTSGLFDARRFTQSLESAFLAMWENLASGKSSPALG